MIDILTKAAYRAANVLRISFGKDLPATAKTNHHDLVTEADIASQKEIVKVISKLAKQRGVKESDIAFIGEENLATAPAKYTFVIDPIDGTGNFVSGNDHFSVAIALFTESQLEAGVVYHVMRDVLYTAERGKGAWKIVGSKKKKLILATHPLKDCLLSMYLSSDNTVRDKQLLVLSSLFPLVRGVRLTGSATLDIASVASGTTNIAIFGRAGLWDIAAPNLLATEAGAIVTDWKGQPLVYDLANPAARYQMVACHPIVHPELLSFLQTI